MLDRECVEDRCPRPNANSTVFRCFDARSDLARVALAPQFACAAAIGHGRTSVRSGVAHSVPIRGRMFPHGFETPSIDAPRGPLPTKRGDASKRSPKQRWQCVFGARPDVVTEEARYCRLAPPPDEACLLLTRRGVTTNLPLAEQIALVTGASTGIGAAIAKSLAQAGADIVSGGSAAAHMPFEPISQTAGRRPPSSGKRSICSVVSTY
jgi:3-oxoacyl-ACP reductase-like protein